MTHQDLRNRQGHLLGRISTSKDGQLELSDPKGHLKGTYDPKRDFTRNRMGHVVGRGNLLATLL